MVENSKAANPGNGGNPNDISITAVYGMSKPLTVNRKQSMNALLQAVLKSFGVTADASTFRLILQATGQDLPLDRSVEDAGVTEGATIVLAPRASGGGC